MLVANKMIENLSNTDGDMARITFRTYSLDGPTEPTSSYYQVDCSCNRQPCESEEFESLAEAREFAAKWLAGAWVA